MTTEKKTKRKPHRQASELPHPDLPPDHESNKLQPIFRARIEPQLLKAAEDFRKANGWSKKEFVEKALAAIMKPPTNG